MKESNNNINSKTILIQEVDSIVEDIINAYNQSGKKTSGNFEDQLEVKDKGNSIELWGVGYLAGRPAGKMPPVQEIENWITLKGIQPIESNMTTSSLAWAIAKKIAKEGTAKESYLPIYDLIITPQRIDSIIDKVSTFHTQQFVHSVTVRLMAITQKFKD